MPEQPGDVFVNCPGGMMQPKVVRASAEARAFFWLSLALYLGVATALVYYLRIIETDAIARVGNAYYVLFSRDPHLSAIGFVWGPLPSMAILPLLPLKVFWPTLVSSGFSSNIVSSLFMAGAVYQMNRILAQLQLRAAMRFVLTAVFALHPMVVYYGANGMSEAPFLFFLLLATRHLAIWIREGALLSEIYAGLALGAAYLTRYEALFAASAIGLVAAITFSRTAGRYRTRLLTGAADAVIFGGPLLLAVAVWAATSWVIVGHPFEHLSSAYGNAAQTQAFRSAEIDIFADGGGSGLFAGGLVQALVRTLALAPFLPVLLLFSLRSRARSQGGELLSVLFIMGPVLAFVMVAYATGNMVTWLRYFITAVPLGILIAGIALAAVKRSAKAPLSGSLLSQSGWSFGRRWAHPLLVALGSGAVIIMAASSLPVAGVAMMNPRVSNLEAYRMAAVFRRDGVSPRKLLALHGYQTEREVATYLDALTLPKGSVLVDTFIGSAIVLNSSREQQFVITSDRDFQVSLSDPQGSGIRYVLVPPPAGLGTLDAVNRAYPGFYESGDGLGVLVREFVNQGDASRDWRLYRVRSTTAT
jgi:hypothetical protein